MISEAKHSIDLVSVVESAGVEFEQRGSRHVGLCPFHDDHNPSFYVFPDGHYKCFSCQEYGDSIDFVQKLYSLPFKDALKYLGIEPGEMAPEVRRDIRKRKLQREKVEAHKKRIADLQNTFLILISAPTRQQNPSTQ